MCEVKFATSWLHCIATIYPYIDHTVVYSHDFSSSRVVPEKYSVPYITSQPSPVSQLCQYTSKLSFPFCLFPYFLLHHWHTYDLSPSCVWLYEWCRSDQPADPEGECLRRSLSLFRAALRKKSYWSQRTDACSVKRFHILSHLSLPGVNPHQYNFFFFLMMWYLRIIFFNLYYLYELKSYATFLVICWFIFF